MRMKKHPVFYIAMVVCLLIVVSLASCGGDDPIADPDPSSPPESVTPPTISTPPPSITPSTPPPPPPPPVELFPYDGVVEHIFFHEVIAWPELAFNGNAMERGYDTNMVTVSEYIAILESLYRNNFILVNLNDVWSEFTNEQGQQRMRRNTLMLPEGKKPLVISFDDLSFYEYMTGDGFMEKYIIGDDGDIWAIGTDPNGNTVISQDLTVITILDKFVKENPGFSHEGAKGCIAFTGYEGILGYRTQFDRTNDTQEARLHRRQEIARARPIVQRLHDTGWYFATHSYGHIWLDSSSLDRVQTDALRWKDEVASLVGETRIFIYPYGSRLDNGDVWDTGPALRFYNNELGFRYFASVGRESFSRIKPDISAVMMDRMPVDGLALRSRRELFLRFYDAAEVFDHSRPTGNDSAGRPYEIAWQT